jgi:predicted ATPase
MWRGDIVAAHAHFRQGIALYDAQQHRTSAFLYLQDTGVSCRSCTAWTSWLLGYPAQGLTRSHEAVRLAQQIDHPFNLCAALSHAAMFHQCRQEVQATQERAAAALRLATEQGFPVLKAVNACLHGWSLGQQGQAQEGMTQINQGARALHAIGVELLRPYHLALLAEAHGTMGQPEEGLALLTEALTLAGTRGERWCEPELYRLKGALLLQQSLDNQAEVEASFHHALEIARTQQAKSLELRTATSLARLWQQQGKRQEARDLLAPVYGWFTEGFDTADLQDAKALLEELTEGRV